MAAALVERWGAGSALAWGERLVLRWALVSGGLWDLGLVVARAQVRAAVLVAALVIRE